MAATQSFLVVGVLLMSWKRGSLQYGLIVATLPYRRRLVNTTQAYPPDGTGFTVGSKFSVTSSVAGFTAVACGGRYGVPVDVTSPFSVSRRVGVLVARSTHQSSPCDPSSLVSFGVSSSPR